MATRVVPGGHHGIPIPVLHTLEEFGKTTTDPAKRMICNFIGTTVRDGYYD